MQCLLHKIFESNEQDVVTHSIEGCVVAQVEENEVVKGTGGSRGEKVVQYFKESSFSAVAILKAEGTIPWESWEFKG